MCKVTNDGIRFKSSGRVINPHLLDFEQLTKEEMIELYETPMTMYDGLSIRKNIHNLRNDMQGIITTLEKTLNEVKFHSDSCPVNVKEIEKIIDENLSGDKHNEFLEKKWVEILNNKIITTGNIAKAVIAIFIVLSTVGGIIYTVAK